MFPKNFICVKIDPAGVNTTGQKTNEWTHHAHKNANDRELVKTQYCSIIWFFFEVSYWRLIYLMVIFCAVKFNSIQHFLISIFKTFQSAFLLKLPLLLNICRLHDRMKCIEGMLLLIYIVWDSFMKIMRLNIQILKEHDNVLTSWCNTANTDQ